MRMPTPVERYLTDGVHLYELIDRHKNLGLVGGYELIVLDVVSETVRTVPPLEAKLFRQVDPE